VSSSGERHLARADRHQRAFYKVGRSRRSTRWDAMALFDCVPNRPLGYCARQSKRSRRVAGLEQESCWERNSAIAEFRVIMCPYRSAPGLFL
jgi:hypothetical protein